MELIIAIVSICIFIALLSFSILKIWLPGYMVREMEQYQNKLLERQFERLTIHIVRCVDGGMIIKIICRCLRFMSKTDSGKMQGIILYR